MVKNRMIKDMPDFPKGRVGEMNNKEAAKMWVEEGYAEYVEEPKKEVSNSREKSKNEEKTTTNDETHTKEEKSSQNASNEFNSIEEYINSIDLELTNIQTNINNAKELQDIQNINLSKFDTIVDDINLKKSDLSLSSSEEKKAVARRNILENKFKEIKKQHKKKLNTLKEELKNIEKSNKDEELEKLKEYAIKENNRILEEFSKIKKIEDILKEFDFFDSNLEYRKQIINELFETVEEINNLIYAIEIVLNKLFNEKVGYVRYNLNETNNSMIREVNKYGFTIFIIKNDIQVYKVSQRAKEHYIILHNNSLSELLHTSHLILNIEMLHKHYTSHMLPKKLDVVKTLIDLHLIKNIYDKGFKPTMEKLFYDDDKLYLNEYKPSELEKKHKKTNFNKEDVSTLLKKDIKKFNTIHNIFTHLVGSKEVFYKDNLELIQLIKKGENPIYEEMFDKKRDFFINTFKTDNIDKLETIFTNNLNNITQEEYSKIDKNLKYLYKYIAFILQNPSYKLPCGIGVFSEKGIGKDFLKDYILGVIFGNHSITSIGQEILNEKFNGYAYGKRLIFCNELSVEASKISMHEKLKDEMTNPTISIRKMHQDAQTIKNYAHYFFFSNKQNMLLVEKGDRRFTIFEQRLKLPDLTIYRVNNSYLDLYELPKDWKIEIEEFYKFLMSIDVNYHQVKEPISTDIKNKMIEYTKTDVEQFIDYCKDSFKCPIEMIEFFAYKNPFIANHIKTETYAQENKKAVEYYVFRDNVFKEYISYDLLFECFKTYKEIANIRGNRNQRSFIKEIDARGVAIWDSINKKTSRFFIYREIFDNFDLTNYEVK